MAEQGQRLMEQARAKMESFHWFAKRTRADDVHELYVKAAIQFKTAKKWAEAGEAYKRSAETSLLPELDETTNAAQNFEESANCYKKVSPSDAVAQMERAVGIYVEMGRFARAATSQKKIAEIYEQDIVDLERAMTAYEKAADWFEGEDQKSNANKCKIKVALFEAEMENYAKAITIFEGIAGYMADNKMLHWSSKEYFFKAGICHLCVGDAVTTEASISKYTEMYPQFLNSTEHKFLLAASKAIEEQQGDELSDRIAKLMQMTRLDDWSVKLLYRCKKALEDDDDDL